MAFGIGTNKNVCRCTVIEFSCSITILEQQIDVWLIDYKEENRWALVYLRE